MVAVNFNATQYTPNTAGQDVLPTGDYLVQITGSELKPTKAQTGHFLALTMTVIHGEQAGKRLTARLNIDNPNKQAVDIAYGELSAISHVIGRLQWQDTQELHGVPFGVSVTCEPRSDDPTKNGNNIKGYMDKAGNPPSAAGASAGAPAQPQAPQPGPAMTDAAPVQAPAPAAAVAPDPATAAVAAPAPAPSAQPVPAPTTAPQPFTPPATPPATEQPAAQAAPAAAGVKPPWEQ